MIIDIIAGARPNFMKIAPLIFEIKKAKRNKKNIDFRLIHTGQHYDDNMSRSFFDDLNLPKPDFNLEAGGGSQAEQTSKIMIAYEKLLNMYHTDLCLVVGDVNSTLACSIVAKKKHIKVAHIEAGIRSFDMSMPEEINRILTDIITDYFFTTSENANNNLLKAGVLSKNIFFVGNTMIDTLLKNEKRFIKPRIWNEYFLEKKKYIVMTLHRPSNVDQQIELKNMIVSIIKNCKGKKIIFPVHPRTKIILDNLKINYPNLILIKPLSYLEFNFLVKNSLAVITDSGGITEETSVMNIPCLTLRENTERPETVSMGTNELVGKNEGAINIALKKIFENKWKKGKIPPLWDGKASERIISALLKLN